MKTSSAADEIFQPQNGNGAHVVEQPDGRGAPIRFAEPENAPALIDDSPMAMARAYWRSVASPMVHHQGDHYQFDCNVYRKLIKEQLRADLWSWAEQQNILRDGKPEPFKPSTRRVNEILDALAAVTQVCVERMPTWLDNDRPRPQDVIAFQNGLLDVGRFVETGETILIPPASEWFSANVLPFSFDDRAQCPQWLAFLKDVCSGDEELIALLQEFFGLCLTDDTSQQKALLLIGPPRSGKGTTIRQLVRTIGDANCASLRLSALGDRFGLESLAGKTVAVCPDAHLGRSSDHVGVLERLKSIIGEDPQCIDLKFREPRPNVRMRVRFVLAVNNLPDLPDSSVAMRSRLLIVPLGNSYEGAEDRGLDDRLGKETDGVLLWAMQGLKRLREQGRFTEPRASRDVLSEFSRLSSPALAFVEDRCKVDSSDSSLWVECDAAWEHWQRWCKQTGTPCGTKQGFGMNLKSAVPQVRRERKSREDGTRFWTYAGIGLIPAECEGDQL